MGSNGFEIVTNTAIQYILINLPAHVLHPFFLGKLPFCLTINY